MESKEQKYLQIKDWHANDRPREKLELKGNIALTDAELLGILIGTGIKNMTAVDLAKQILASVNNDLFGLSRLTLKDLSKFKGIGKAKAINILAALELGRRRKDAEGSVKLTIQNAKNCYEILRPYLQDLQHEEFYVIYAKQNLEVIFTGKISSGGISQTTVDTKLIFKKALENNATCMVLAHNHPSGSTKPSQADYKITAKVLEAAKLFDISVIDHLIFTDQGYYSFSENDLMDINTLKRQ